MWPEIVGSSPTTTANGMCSQLGDDSCWIREQSNILCRFEPCHPDDSLMKGLVRLPRLSKSHTVPSNIGQGYLTVYECRCGFESRWYRKWSISLMVKCWLVTPVSRVRFSYIPQKDIYSSRRITAREAGDFGSSPKMSFKNKHIQFKENTGSGAGDFGSSPKMFINESVL